MKSKNKPAVDPHFEENVEILRTLDSLSLEAARAAAERVLKNWCKTSSPEVVTRLKSHVAAAPSAREICRIMWYAFHAGEGNRVVGSNWITHARIAA